jgi:hypothetical protein
MSAPLTALPLLGPWALPCTEPRVVTVTYHDGRTEDVTEEELRARFGAHTAGPAARYTCLEWVDRALAARGPINAWRLS